MMESISPVNPSLEEKCMDKSWATRLRSYEEATKLFRQIKNRKSPEFHKFIGLIKSFVTDNHASAQEKGLEAALAYIENYGQARNIAHDVMNGIVTKCFAARRVKTKELAVQITHKFVQLGKQEVVQEELLSGMEQKKNQPKTISACINAFTFLLQKFGTEIINIEPLMKKIGPLLSDRDKTVRDDTKLMIVELYKWIGRDAMLRRLKKVDIQAIHMNELEEEFIRIESEKISLEKKEVKCVKKDPIQSTETTFLLPKDFYEKIQAKTWQERREALRNIEGLLTTPLQNANYSDLIRALTVVIEKDSNVICVALAARCLVLLANGLKDKFQNYCSLCIPVLLEKFKERKQCVITAIQEALDSIYSTTTLEFILENIVEALSNKNPSVKTETQLFLSRNFRKTSPSVNKDKRVLTAITMALLKNLHDSDSSVRETSAETLGSLMRTVGEDTMLAHLKEVDDLKMLKIKEYSNFTVVETKDNSNMVDSETTKEIKKCNTSARNHCKKAEKELSEEEINGIITEIFTTDIINDICCNNWRNRLQAAQKMLTVIQTKSGNIPTHAVVKFLIRKPGLKDTNVQVVKTKLDIIKHLAEHCRFKTSTANYCVPDVCERLMDSKNIIAVVDTLNAIAEATSLAEVAKTVIDFAFNQKSPKVQQESLLWLSGAVKEFGLEGLNVNFLIDASKQGISCSNGAVRLAAITLLGVVYSYVGSSLFGLIEGTKSSVLELIKAECEKYNGKKPPAPTRGVNKVGECLKKTAECVSDKDEKVRASVLNCMTEASSKVDNKIQEVPPENNVLLIDTVVKANVVSSDDLIQDGPKLLEENKLTSCNDKISTQEELQIHKTEQEYTELLKVEVPLSPNKEIKKVDYETMYREFIQEHREKIRADLTQKYEQIYKKLYTFRKPDLSLCNLSAIDQQTLTNIFEKLHTEDPDDALNLLYDFMQSRSGIDLKPFLDASSMSVQKYVPGALEDLHRWHVLRKTIESFRKQWELKHCVTEF